MKDSIKTNLVAYIPLFTPLDSNERGKQFWALIDELPTLSSKISFAYLEESDWSQVVLTVFDGQEKPNGSFDKVFHKAWSSSNKARARYILKISVCVTFFKSFAQSALKDWKASKADKVQAY